MKINCKLIVFLILLFNNWVTFSQHIKKQNELVHLTFVNKDICTILDSIVIAEKKCEYYNKRLIFSISIRKIDNAYSIIIESMGDSNIAYGSSEYGYFYYQNHLMLVDGDTCESVFSKTKEKKKFKYIQYDPFYQEKGNPMKVYYFSDDSFSQWSFWFTDNKFKFESKSSFCPK